MNAICRLLRHRASIDIVWNDGRHFGRCTRCGCELIRSGGPWTSVPKGFRIVWRNRTDADIDWSQWKHRTFQPEMREAPPADRDMDFKVVGDAPERRDPASPGGEGLLGGQRENDHRRAA